MSKKQTDIRNWFCNDNKGEEKEESTVHTESIIQTENQTDTGPREIMVFTDGSAINNGSKNAKGGVGVFFADNDSRNISKSIVSSNINGNVKNKVTNNICELIGVILAIEKIVETEPTMSKLRIVVMTDSEYIVKSVLKYSINWRKNGYKNKQGKPIKNIVLMKKVIELVEKYNVKLHHCPAHRTEPKDPYKRKIWYGNKMADLLARQGSK